MAETVTYRADGHGTVTEGICDCAWSAGML